MTENGAQRAQAARAGRTVSACAFVGGGVMLTLNFLFGREAGFPGGAVGGAIGAAVGGVVGIGINKLKSKSERTPKLGFLGWAFSGGLFFGKVPGSNLGGIGAAFIGAGAIPAFRAINTYPNAPIVLIGSLVLGCWFLAGGYGRYCSASDSKSDQEDKAHYISPRTMDETQTEKSAPPEPIPEGYQERHRRLRVDDGVFYPKEGEGVVVGPGQDRHFVKVRFNESGEEKMRESFGLYLKVGTSRTTSSENSTTPPLPASKPREPVKPVPEGYQERHRRLRVNDQVFHPNEGEGVVIAPGQDRYFVKVRFRESGEEKMRESFGLYLKI